MKRLLVWAGLASLLLTSTGALVLSRAPETPEEFVASEDGTFVVTLRELGSYRLDLPSYRDPELTEKINAQVPASIKQLDGKTVEVDGFVMPFDFDRRGAVSRLLLMPSVDHCHFGGGAQFHEMVDVHLTTPDQYLGGMRPHRVRGVLTVGVHWTPEGELSALYTIRAESVHVLRRDGSNFRR